MAGVKTFTPIRQRRWPELVFQQIVEAILDGTYKAGDRLPAEKDLAAQFHVSRGVIREALRMLEQSGLVTVKLGAHGGAHVCPADSGRLSKGLALLLQRGQATLGELLEARKILEAVNAELAATHATAEDLKAVQQTLDELPEEPSAADFIQHNRRFHLAVAQATRNRVLAMLMGTLQDLIGESLQKIRIDDGVVARATRGHREICAAIASRDKARARAVMLQHIEGFERKLKASLADELHIGQQQDRVPPR